jgi:hypothetical protein
LAFFCQIIKKNLHFYDLQHTFYLMQPRVLHARGVLTIFVFGKMVRK